MLKRLTIFALGGNEVAPTGRTDPKTGKLVMPDLAEQWQRTAETCKLLAQIIKENPDDYYIITHGNGPQVGNVILREENSYPQPNIMPLDVCDADTQGSMGYMLAQLTNNLKILGINRIAAETVTRVVVNKNDPNFFNPTKFIGPSYTKEEAQKKQSGENRMMKFYKKNGNDIELWRWVVPSPHPIDIIEINVIENNMLNNIIPIAVGGGGIPVVKVLPEIVGDEEIYKSNFDIVYKRKYNPLNDSIDIYTGAEAVVDKDLASSLLGKLILERAELRGENIEAQLIIFTDVDGVKLNYQQDDQKDLRHLSLIEIKSLYNNGVFPAGSMGPKIESAINFLENGGKKVIITKASLYNETLSGNAGTVISLT
jgi:carbamate kinase